jgi:hypothetical protein
VRHTLAHPAASQQHLDQKGLQIFPFECLEALIDLLKKLQVLKKQSREVFVV